MPWKKPYVDAHRADFCREVLQLKARGFAALCREFGISRRVGYKWWRRIALEPEQGVKDRSRRRRAGSKLHARWWELVHAARRRECPVFGARKIRAVLREDHPFLRLPSRNTIHRWLLAAELIARRRRASPGPWRRAPQVRRARQPNDVWTLDFKGWFRTGDGTRIQALTVRDAYSGAILDVWHLPQASEAAVRRRFRHLFRRYGLPRALLMDRGAPWCGGGPYGWTRLSVWWLSLGIEPCFTRRAKPQDNAAHEQMHRILKAATANPPAPTAKIQQRWLETWRCRYNQRPYAGHDEKPPAQFYRPSPRRFPCRRCTWIYPRTWSVARVTRSGYIRWLGKLRVIGRAFYAERVGLRPAANQSASVYLGPHLLGKLHVSESSLSVVRLLSPQWGRG
jgi:putative transposase